jgi:hypothetical protein
MLSTLRALRTSILQKLCSGWGRSVRRDAYAISETLKRMRHRDFTLDRRVRAPSRRVSSADEERKRRTTAR